jgi:UDP-N-acetylglucosamine 4,6-dehydratase
MFIVQPSGSLWFGYDWSDEGLSLPDGFRYGSDTNPQWLTIEQMHEIIAPFEELETEKDSVK